MFFDSLLIQNPILLKFALSFFLWKDFIDNSKVGKTFYLMHNSHVIKFLKFLNS
jgi:hypothetical protein